VAVGARASVPEPDERIRYASAFVAVDDGDDEPRAVRARRGLREIAVQRRSGAGGTMRCPAAAPGGEEDEKDP
jgi:hypothetical protein